jgi:hypothetical protein
VARPNVYSRSVFINCPFSSDYQPIFRAICFAVYACTFRPRCALEIRDSGLVRLSKIQDIIRKCQYGIHDISFMDLDSKSGLPRLNMSFELGLFLASKSFGTGIQKRKNALILDRSGYRYQKALSDISGQDIALHNSSPKKAICEVRDWLDTCQAGAYSLPGGDHIHAQFKKFSKQLPSASAAIHLNASKLTFSDVCRAIESWLKDNA